MDKILSQISFKTFLENWLQFLEIEFFQISLFRLFLFLLVLTLLYFLKNVIFRLYKNGIQVLHKYTKTTIDEQILIVSLPLFKIFYLVTSVYFTVQILSLSRVIMVFLDKIYISIVYFLLSWAGFIFIDLIRENIDVNFKSDSKLRREIINFIIKFLKTIIVIISISAFLSLWGYNISGILASLGIGGLAFALAAKDSASNLFGSLVILWDKPFVYGDWIVVDKYEGTVVEIGIRSTTVRTFDNALVTMPNAILATQPIKNWSMRKFGRRIKFNLGFTYASKPENLKKFIQDFKELVEKHPKTATNLESSSSNLVSQKDAQGIKDDNFIVLNGFGPSSIDVLIYCFSHSVDWGEWLTLREELMFEIMRLAKINHLEFAFPSQSIYIEKVKNL